MKKLLTSIFLFTSLYLQAQITPTPITSPRIAFDYFIFQDTVIFGSWAYPFTGTPVVNLRILPGALPTDNTDTKVLSFDVTTKNVSLRDAGLLMTTVNSPLSLSGGTLSLLYQMSITADGSGLKLVNDQLTPGNNYIYGTNSIGTKGWRKLKKADFDDLDEHEIVFGNQSGNGQAESSDDFTFDDVLLGDAIVQLKNTQGGFMVSTQDPLDVVTVGNSTSSWSGRSITFSEIDGDDVFGSNFSSSGFGLSYGTVSGGVTTNQIYGTSDYISWWVTGAKETKIYRTLGGSVYSLYLPNSQGGANTVLRNDGSGNLTWVSFGVGSLTNFSFVNDNGFIGDVLNPTTTPELTLSTDILNTRVPFVYENVDGIHRGFKGVAEFYFVETDLELHLDGVNADLFVGGKTFLGTTTTTNFLADGRLHQYNGVTTTPGCMLIGEAGGGIMKILNAGTIGQHLRVKADLEPEWYTPIYADPLDYTGETISILGLSTVGTAGQMIRINAGATGFEYFSPAFLTAEVDGSTTNELQDLSYDAANREVDISLGGTSATLPLAVDDGATEGFASFTAADFTVTSGNVVIDYANGQAGTSGQDGFIQSADWTTFNNKVGIVDIEEFTAQTASIGATTTYTTPASDGYYRISVTATITTAAGTSMDLAVQLRYTESTDNVVKTFPTANINNYNRTQTNTTGASVSITSVCHIKASTNIQFLTSFSPVGGSPQYNIHVTVEKLQ